MEKIKQRVRAMPLSPAEIVQQIDQDFKGLVLAGPGTGEPARFGPVAWDDEMW